ncbi:hypothetical protein GXY_05586 [Novacetimonas hansenii ATCC 23769]|uniref:Uncharacterized protein n=1 Tax=Novacetimonas hansenii ATCC 23769 TaxID=714995 RepID=D5QDB1_NOVHA|nr:hypothetical protein GXY_05586 [Novacetimonas hansenii ATCC 23769]
MLLGRRGIGAWVFVHSWRGKRERVRRRWGVVFNVEQAFRGRGLSCP